MKFITYVIQNLKKKINNTKKYVKKNSVDGVSSI